MDFKLIGCILLIVGTSIGAGMLGLPIATAQLGFAGSVMLLIFSWFVMTTGALLILEVNLWLPNSSNLISMAKVTIGPVGQVIAWITYLLLLYSLLCAYISAGSDLFLNLLKSAGLIVPHWTAAVIFTIVFGFVVYNGIRSVDYVNRGLMTFKFLAYFLLIILLMPYISFDKLAAGDLKMLLSGTAITVTICSFGYATIVPSLRFYFHGDLKKLKTAIVVGSTIPLICYIIWDAAIMGIIPIDGEHGLASILQSKNSTSDLVNTLTAIVSKDSVSFFAKLFTSICVLTSFLGVSLCLADFFADGLQMEKKGGNNLLIHAITFIPPLVMVLFFPNLFIKGLQYAGIYSVILLILLPAWMAWHGRYDRHIAKGFTVAGGKGLLIFLMLFSIYAIVNGFVSSV